MGRQRRFNPAVAYFYGACFLILLLCIDYLASIGLFASLLDESLSPLIGTHSLSSGLLVGAIYTAVIYFVFNRISETFIILNKPGVCYAIALFGGILVATRLQLDWGGLLQFGLLVLSLVELYASYQEAGNVNSHLKVGIYWAALTLYDARLIYLLPLWLYASHRLQCLSLRTGLGLLTGFISSLSISATYLLYQYGIEGLQALWAVWLNPIVTVEPLLGHTPQFVDWLCLSLWAIIAGLSYSFGSNRESIRQRKQGSVLVGWLVLGLIGLQIYPSNTLALLTLIPTAILSARGLSFIEGKALKITLCIVALTLLSLTIVI